MIGALRRIPLFEGLNDDELRWVVEQGSEKLVRASEINGWEGEPVEHLYVILEGELTVTKEVDGGEVPLLSGTPFLATGRALSDCRFFLLPGGGIGEPEGLNAAEEESSVR